MPTANEDKRSALENAQLEKQAKIDAFEQAEVLRIGQIAIEAGLADIKIKKSDLKAGFVNMANSFPPKRRAQIYTRFRPRQA